MTKERRLAIQMWEAIRVNVQNTKHLKEIDRIVGAIKYRFMLDHNLNWKYGCWFCHYVRYYDDLHGEGCQRCPLSDGFASTIEGFTSGCGGNAYTKVLKARMRKTKLKACDEIIATLKGEIYGKRKSSSGNGRSVRGDDTAN